MSKKTMFCKSCREKEIEPFLGYMTFCNSDKICPYCKTELQELNFPADDFNFLRNKVSKNINFLESMIKLHDTDPIEYQLKMSQFRANLDSVEQKSSIPDNRPKCPTCGSTNLSKISTVKKATKIGLFGIFGAGDIGKTYKCNNCGSRF